MKSYKASRLDDWQPEGPGPESVSIVLPSPRAPEGYAFGCDHERTMWLTQKLTRGQPAALWCQDCGAVRVPKGHHPKGLRPPVTATIDVRNDSFVWYYPTRDGLPLDAVQAILDGDVDADNGWCPEETKARITKVRSMFQRKGN
jgi:hypothetical protein